MQLYLANFVGSTLTNNNPADLDSYGQDPEAPTPEGEGDSAVIIPETQLPLSRRSLTTLQASVNPLEYCDDYGVQFYIHLCTTGTPTNAR